MCIDLVIHTYFSGWITLQKILASGSQLLMQRGAAVTAEVGGQLMGKESWFQDKRMQGGAPHPDY